MWTTATGSFNIDQNILLSFTLPEFTNKKVVTTDFSVLDTDDCQYDMILDRNSLQDLEITIDSQSDMIEWQEFKIPMKDPVELHMNEQLFMVFTETLEPEAIKSSNKCITQILDAKYEKADLECLVCKECSHLSNEDQQKLLKLLLEYEGLFDGTLGDLKQIHFL